MWKNLTDYFFWFTQPSSFLSDADKVLIYGFIGLVALAILLRLIVRFASANAVNKKLLMKIWTWAITIGISGVIWAVFRYESTPVFAKRYWAGLNILIGLVWLAFILKYLIFNYREERQEYNKELLKSKYLPRAR